MHTSSHDCFLLKKNLPEKKGGGGGGPLAPSSGYAPVFYCLVINVCANDININVMVMKKGHKFENVMKTTSRDFFGSWRMNACFRGTRRE